MLPPRADYGERTICINPMYANRGLEVTLRLYSGEATCATTFALNEAFVDDVTVTTDPACPF